MSCCYHHHCDHFCPHSCGHPSYCPYPQWVQPILCNPAHYCDAEYVSGPTLVIHQIQLEPCGNQSCTPRTFTIRITGPSYPNGETFTLRAGSCTEVDEPLVITGLIPGQYEIEQLNSACGCSEYDTTYTGPISCNSVAITASRVPVVITIVSRKRICRRRRQGCGCGGNSGYHGYNGYGGGCLC